MTVLEPDADRRAQALTSGAALARAPGTLPHDRFNVAVESSASPAGFAEGLSHRRPGGRGVPLASDARPTRYTAP